MLHQPQTSLGIFGVRAKDLYSATTIIILIKSLGVTIMSPESKSTEYKVELPDSPDKFEKEVVAFLNSKQGGKMYFGIEDTGVICGLADVDTTQLKIKDRLKNNILPSCLEFCDIDVVPYGKNNVLVLDVSSGWRKPYYIKKYGMTPRGCYRRIASSAEPMSDFEIESIFSKRVRHCLTNIPSPNRDLSFAQLKIYYEGKGKVLNDRFMQSLGLVTADGEPNYAAYLLADENRNMVMFAKYLGTNRVDLIANEVYGNYCLVKSFERLEDRLSSENTTFAKITPKRRLERNLINKVALREAILNALLHNDYANGNAPKVEFFSDRVEITSYGGLPYGVEAEDFFAGYSHPRNPELMKVFRDLDIAEHLGSGVPRIIEVYGKDAFIISENYLRVVLPFARGFADGAGEPREIEAEASKSELRIIKLIEDNPKITIPEMASSAGVSERQVRRVLDELQDVGAVRRCGSRKTGRWEVSEPEYPLYSRERRMN